MMRSKDIEHSNVRTWFSQISFDDKLLHFVEAVEKKERKFVKSQKVSFLSVLSSLKNVVLRRCQTSLCMNQRRRRRHKGKTPN